MFPALQSLSLFPNLSLTLQSLSCFPSLSPSLSSLKPELPLLSSPTPTASSISFSFSSPSPSPLFPYSTTGHHLPLLLSASTLTSVLITTRSSPSFTSPPPFSSPNPTAQPLLTAQPPPAPPLSLSSSTSDRLFQLHNRRLKPAEFAAVPACPLARHRAPSSSPKFPQPSPSASFPLKPSSSPCSPPFKPSTPSSLPLPSPRRSCCRPAGSPAASLSSPQPSPSSPAPRAVLEPLPPCSSSSPTASELPAVLAGPSRASSQPRPAAPTKQPLDGAQHRRSARHRSNRSRIRL